MPNNSAFTVSYFLCHTVRANEVIQFLQFYAYLSYVNSWPNNMLRLHLAPGLMPFTTDDIICATNTQNVLMVWSVSFPIEQSQTHFLEIEIFGRNTSASLVMLGHD